MSPATQGVGKVMAVRQRKQLLLFMLLGDALGLLLAARFYGVQRPAAVLATVIYHAAVPGAGARAYFWKTAPPIGGEGDVVGCAAKNKTKTKAR